MGVLDKLKRASTVKGSAVVSESEYFNNMEYVDTGIPALNIILSGKWDGGLGTGLTFLAAPKASLKTVLSLRMVAAYLEKYPEAGCIFYDSEHGSSVDYMKANGIDVNRVLHVPVSSLEELKFDMLKQLDEGIEKGDKVIILVDSIAMLSSNKEVQDARDQKSTVDMTKAKEAGSLMRIITPRLNVKQIPCLMVNHVYKDISTMYGGNINAGGEKMQYAGNTIIHISKAKEKEGKDLVGFRFNLIANKSRVIKEGSTIPLIASFEYGIQKWSGMFDLALELGWIQTPKQGWYMPINKNTGEELYNSNLRRKDVEFDEEFWHKMLNLGFDKDIERFFKLSGNKIELDTEETTEKIEI